MQGVGADFAGALDGVGCAARRAQMDADALGQVHSLLDEEKRDRVYGFPGPQKRGTGGTRLIHRIPPPILWAQNPCFLEVTRRVALQNIENNEVPCKIFLAKELRDVSGSAGRFRLTDGAKRTCRDDWRESF